MGIKNTAKHLAFLKAQLKKLRASEEAGTYFLVFDRATKEALLHVDLVASPAKFKSPKVIHQRLQRAKKLNPAEYEDFFGSKKLVSVAGSAEYEGKTLGLTLKAGKANAGDLKAALRFFKFIPSYTIGEPSEEDGTEDGTGGSSSVSKAKALLAGGLDADGVAASLQDDRVGGVDGLLEMIGDLEEALDADDLSDDARAELAALLETLAEARDQIDAWLPPEEGGPLGLAAGFDELISQADIDEAAEELIADHIETARGMWSGTLSAVREALGQVASVAPEAAGELPDDQDPGGLSALGSVDALVELLLEDVPERVRAVLEDDAQKIVLNRSVVDAVIADLGAHRAVLPGDLVRVTDDKLGLSLGETLAGSVDQLVRHFQGLRARIR